MEVPMGLTKREAIKHFRDTDFIAVVLKYERDGIADGPARREAFCDCMDMLNKNGDLSAKQVETIDANVDSWRRPSRRAILEFAYDYGVDPDTGDAPIRNHFATLNRAWRYGRGY
jgi:hypothetical protein